MSASGVHGWPLAGIAQTRTVAPASGTPRVLNTMSSLRDPCPCAGFTTPGHKCSAIATIVHKIPIRIFDRIMAFFALWYSIRPMGGQFPIAIHVKLTPSEVYWAAVLVTARQLRKVLWIFGVMGLLLALLLVLSWLHPRPGADWY